MYSEATGGSDMRLGVLAVVVIVGLAGCGGSKKAECDVGSQGCDCTPGGACDDGLVCVDGTCEPDPGDATTDGSVDGVDDAADGTGEPVVDVVEDGADVLPDFVPEVPPSCEGMAGDECGGASCCETVVVPGGWFAMGRGEETPCASAPTGGAACTSASVTCLATGTTWGCPEGTWLDLGGDDHMAITGGEDELPEHPVRVSRFVLDVFEVTVGRMRAFVEAYDRTALVALLDAGAGEHPRVSGSGWDGWDSRLPADRDALETALACHDDQTWTDAAGDNETYPINCLSWYLAYAFCAWDGGRLPTEAEWEHASVGGDENRLYPWGDALPDATRVNCLSTDNTPLVDVFAKPAGAGLWGHEGMAGSMWEWVLDLHAPDWYSTGGASCVDCANVSGTGARIMKGGDWQYTTMDLRGANRFAGSAGSYWLGAGLRCARDL